MGPARRPAPVTGRMFPVESSARCRAPYPSPTPGRRDAPPCLAGAWAPAARLHRDARRIGPLRKGSFGIGPYPSCPKAAGTRCSRPALRAGLRSRQAGDRVRNRTLPAHLAVPEPKRLRNSACRIASLRTTFPPPSGACPPGLRLVEPTPELRRLPASSGALPASFPVRLAACGKPRCSCCRKRNPRRRRIKAIINSLFD